MPRLPLWTLALLGCAWLFVAGNLRAEETGGVAESLFSADQLEQLVAPIALYPDSLVAQILMASTYPLEIVQAARWRQDNSDLEGDELELALADQSWDPSVKALTNFADLLERMNENLDWTQDLGDAVLAQEGEVMDAIQRMRHLAKEAGNLETTEEQKVIVEEKIIVVEPAAEVVYVPAYSPTVVYGSVWVPTTWYYPFYGYPRSYWYPPGYAASNLISFSIGVAVGAAIWRNWSWGRCDWRRGGVTINNNFNFSRNINTRDIKIGNRAGGGNFSKWEHNAKHRGGVRYRDNASKQRFERAGEAGRTPRIDRDTARGFDRSAKQDRARPDGGDRKRPESRGLKATQSRDVKPKATRDLDLKPRDSSVVSDRSLGGSGKGELSSQGSRRSGAFDVGGGSFDRAASNRGASSRRSGSFGGGSRGGARGGGRGGGSGLRR
jgi:hypothetical protein